MNMTTDTPSTNDLIDQALALRERIEGLQAEYGRVLDLLRELGPGEHGDHGRRVVVAAAARRFNLDKAVELLPPSAREAAQKITYDAKVVRSLLPPALAETCMEPGSGALRVVLG